MRTALESKVLAILREVYDHSGHWAKAGTLEKLQGPAYWPGQSDDVEIYIAGCVDYARHSPAIMSQPLYRVLDTLEEKTYDQSLKGSRYAYRIPYPEELRPSKEIPGSLNFGF